MHCAGRHCRTAPQHRDQDMPPCHASTAVSTPLATLPQTPAGVSPCKPQTGASSRALHALASCQLKVLPVQCSVLCHCLLPFGGDSRHAGEQIGLRGQESADLRLQLCLGSSEGLNLQDTGTHASTVADSACSRAGKGGRIGSQLLGGIIHAGAWCAWLTLQVERTLHCMSKVAQEMLQDGWQPPTAVILLKTNTAFLG